jgi:hypothetical protein
MELIPILATIILVATISTFVLAIGAYILYKVREGKTQRVEIAQPSTVQAELLVPETVAEQIRVQEPVRQPGQILYQPSSAPSYKPQVEPIFVQQRAQAGPQPVQARYTPPPQQYVAPKQERQQAGPQPDQKFMKYTAEGYVSAKEKEQGALKWR